MMFSATFTKEAREMAAKYLQEEHIRIKVGRSGSVHENIVQDVSIILSKTFPKALLIHATGRLGRPG